MVKIQYGRDSERPSLGYQDGRNAFTDELLENFQILEEIELSHQQWSPVAIETTNGFVVLEIQDSGWIYKVHRFGPSGDILWVKAFLGETYLRSDPHLIFNYLTSNLGQDVEETLEAWINQVTIYEQPSISGFFNLYQPAHLFDNISLKLLVQTSNGNFYDLIQQEQATSNSDDWFTHLPVSQDISWYLIYLRHSFQILGINRMGEIQVERYVGNSEHEPFRSYRSFSLPASLNIGPGYVPPPNIPNHIAENRLSFLFGNNMLIDDYSISINNPGVYFAWNGLTPYLQNGETINLETNQSENLPEGSLVKLDFHPDSPEVVLVVKNNLAVLYILDNQNELRHSQVVIIGDSELEAFGLFPIVGQGLAYDRIRQVFPGITISDFNETLPERLLEPVKTLEKVDSNLILRQCHDRFMAYMYNKPYTEPNILDGYSRIDYSELISENQIVRQEVSLTMQPFAGPPGTENEIILLITSDGRKLFVKARLDPETKQILPPV